MGCARKEHSTSLISGMLANVSNVICLCKCIYLWGSEEKTLHHTVLHGLFKDFVLLVFRVCALQPWISSWMPSPKSMAVRRWGLGSSPWWTTCTGLLLLHQVAMQTWWRRSGGVLSTMYKTYMNMTLQHSPSVSMATWKERPETRTGSSQVSSCFHDLLVCQYPEWAEGDGWRIDSVGRLQVG